MHFSQTITAMPSNGLRRTSLSIDTKFDADYNAQQHLNPLLGIGVVRVRLFYIHPINNKSNTCREWLPFNT